MHLFQKFAGFFLAVVTPLAVIAVAALFRYINFQMFGVSDDLQITIAELLVLNQVVDAWFSTPEEVFVFASQVLHVLLQGFGTDSHSFDLSVDSPPDHAISGPSSALGHNAWIWP